MKNKLRNLLILLCLLFSAKDVWAYDNNTVFKNLRTDASDHHQVKYGTSESSAKAYNNILYHVENNSNSSEKYFAYCADPHLSAAVTLGVDHILMEDDGAGYSKAADYGLLSILKNGKWKYEYAPTTNEEKIDYEATSMAARMYLNGVASQSYRDNSTAVFKSYIGTLYSWISTDSQMKEDYIALTGNTNLSYIHTQYNIQNPSYYFFFSGNYGTQVEAKAKQFLKNGLRAAVKYKNGEVKEVEHSIVKVGTFDLNKETVSGNTTYEKLVVVSISLKNFTLTGDKPGYFYYQGIDAITSSNTNVTEIGYSLDYSSTADDYSKNGKLNSNQNLVELLADNNKESVYIAYKVVITTDGLNCNANFRLRTKYFDENLLNGAILVPKNDAGKDYTDGQRFMIYSNMPSEKEDEIITVVCPSVCDPDIGIPQICDDGKTPDADGNVTYEYHEGYENDRENIKKCILKNTDSANNTYKLQDDKYARLVSSNPYCSVYCKEEYKFTVPYKKNVINGRYFNLELEIEGQQQCFTTKIDRDKYNSEIIKAQKEVINAYNEWLEYYELVNNELEDTGEDFVCTKRSCEKVDTTDEETGEITDYTCQKGAVSTRRSKDKLQIAFTGNYYDYNETANGLSVFVSLAKRPSNVVFGEKKSDYIGTCEKKNDSCEYKETATCDILTSQDDYDSKKADYEKTLNEKASDLEGKINALNNEVKKFNSCMDNWEMVYLFDPEIKFDYDEPNPNGSDDKYLDDSGCTGALCNIMVPTSEIIEAKKCDKDDKEKGRCKEVGTTKDIFTNSTINTSEYCSSNNLNESNYKCSNPQTSVSYNKEQYFSCDINGEGKFDCGIHDYNVTNMTYAKKVATSKGVYDTPRVFYSLNSSGAIKVTTDPKDNNYNLVDGLPVGSNTPSGTYYYTLSINNLGRYFDSHRLGRIFGNNSTSLSIAVRDKLATTLNDNELKGNQYACTYAVNQSCTDANGIDHGQEECAAGEDWNACKERLCPTQNTSYCVKESEAYYVCDSQSYNKNTCRKMNSREDAINNSQVNYNCCPDCKVFCVGSCVYDFDDEDGGGLMLEFRPISPSAPNPNNRPLGYNWNVNNPTNRLVAQKAENTLYEITTRANVDVENAGDEELEEINSYNMKIKLTPEMATWIREYNKNAEDKGSYNNDTLECYDYKMSGESYTEATCKDAGYTWKDNTCVMSNVFCYSTFIDELVEKFEEEVDAPNREEAKTTAFRNYEKMNNLPQKETQIITNDYWTIYRYTTLYTENSNIPLVGPSWK